MPKTGALTKLYKHALVYPFVILFFSSPLHSFSPLAVSLDALGSVSPGERYVIHYLTFQSSLDGPPLLFRAPLMALFPDGPGLVLPEVPLSLEHLGAIMISRLTRRVQGNRSFHCPLFPLV